MTADQTSDEDGVLEDEGIPDTISAGQNLSPPVRSRTRSI